MSALASAAERETGPEKGIAFDIPPQPLASALDAYGATTQVEMFYDGALAVGHRSHAIQGVFTAEEALRRLLEGTGFAAQSTDVGVMTIGKPEAISSGQLALVRNRSVGFTPYLAQIQSSLRAALCRDASLQSEAMSLLVRFWIAPPGTVARAALLTSTGDRERDAAYANALQTLDIGLPPPPGMPQPVTMMILPRNSPTAAGCDAAGRQTAAQ